MDDPASLPTDSQAESTSTVKGASDREASSSEDIEREADGADVVQSEPFVGRWNKLVSATNWEKGRIICQWRDALRDEGAEVSEYSDEAWAQLVGGVTGQHVGRLRRVAARFGAVREQYEGLYWSHFCAALDWEDAEMWLEGALQNEWSVSQLRKTRWETLGAPAELKPREEDVIVMELDEDDHASQTHPPDGANTSDSREAATAGPSTSEAEASDDEAGSSDSATQTAVPNKKAADMVETDDVSAEPVRPFENLSELPEDLTAAFESFKLAILRHKANQWQDISQNDVLASLDALKQLAVAPSLDD